MSALENFSEKFKHFKPTTWSIKNRTTIYLIMVFVSLAGVFQFITLPKEQFPDIVIPNIYVQTIYAGNTPRDIENLVTQPIEKQIKSITGVKVNKVTSTSQQDYSTIIIEFDTDVDTDIALQKVKDAVDKAKTDLPTDLTQDPIVLEVSLSDQPIMYVNLSGNYDPVRLKTYADEMQDRLEELPQINRVDIVGAPEREFQINVDNQRMQAAGVTFDDIAGAVSRENMDISGGQLEVGNMRRNLQLKGQFKTAYDIQGLVIRNNTGAPIYLRDIAEVRDTIKERESYARLNGKNVITMNVVKRSGENLIETAAGVDKIVEDLKTTVFPKDLDVVITGDQSINARNSFNELVNTIVIGFILVLVILMFFMGVVNAFFVALSVPLSIFVAFLFIPGAELIAGSAVTLNFIVLFALLFGLGIIVDDAIVVIENTHRIFMEGRGRVNSEKSAMMAAGEVFVPVLAGTLTTLAPFIPLLFWPGIIGKFMIYLPTMLIFTLAASLVVAFIMNPVFAVDFMNHEEGVKEPKSAIFRKKSLWIGLGLGILLDLIGATFFGNLLILIILLMVFNRYILDDVIHSFQNRVLPGIMRRYEQLLNWALKGWRPVWLLLATFGLFILSIGIFIIATSTQWVKVVFFPKADPNFIYTYIKLPVGTDVEYTDSITHVLENRVYKVLGMENGKTNPIVESVISNTAVGAADPSSGDRSTRSELGRIQVSFVEFEKRHGHSTAPYLDSIRSVVRGIPGAEISVAQESSGPPTDPPVNIEVASEDIDALIKTAVSLKNYLDSINVPGIEELKMDVDLSNPEITLSVNRERALIEGVSSAQIGMQIRTALFGREVSKIKEGEDEYKIQLRNKEVQRRSLTDLLNMNVSFRDFNGQVKRIPISSLVTVDYTSTQGSVKRKDYKRVISVRSNVLDSKGFTAQSVNAELTNHLANFKNKPENVTIAQTGEGAQQAETVAFLGGALMIALGIILITLVIQFNSISKPIIILTEILFSVIGVLLGFSLTGMSVSGIFTGLGIVGLAGIVVKNGILVVEFAEELRGRGLKTREAIIEAGKTRIIPVMLTALAAIFGLLPLAVGFNIDFVGMFAELDPNIFFGGDSARFWAPLAWTLIFGLIFAFFMTLFVLPGMYLITERLRRPMRRIFGGKWVSMAGLFPIASIGLLFISQPVAALIAFLAFPVMLIITMIIHKRDVARRRRKLKGVDTANKAFIGSWL
ncbi:MAG: efflux transporter permease subunit [Flaviaesturariibacter sp.]|nr:efflux transporter permease subunit [Flaviaesturariibacter sp.]